MKQHLRIDGGKMIQMPKILEQCRENIAQRRLHDPGGNVLPDKGYIQLTVVSPAMNPKPHAVQRGQPLSFAPLPDRVTGFDSTLTYATCSFIQ